MPTTSSPIGVSHVFHLNVNCSDLDRSLAFYRDGLGLSSTVRTTSPEQPGDAFGLDRVAWDAWILTGDRGYDGVAVDLLEWHTPGPTGAPPPVANHLGFTRLGFATSDIDAAYERLVAAGADCFGPPHDIALEGAPSVRAFVATDPDGTMFELVSGDGDRLSFVAIGCTDLDRSVAFYSEVLGFRPLARFAPGPSDGATLRLGPSIEWELAYLDDPRDTGAFALDLVQWTSPPAQGRTATSANQLGIYRMALITDDIDRDHAALIELGVECVTPPATLDMGPDLPALRALLFPDPDGTMLELIEAPTV
jgi:catechol 2,3-dioxygenase-like lactoylglutathione lyase family enzyme